MELTQNWKAFERFFVPRRRPQAEFGSAQAASPVFIIEESEIILAALGEGELLEEWIGRTVAELKDHLGARELNVISWKAFREISSASITQGANLDQALESVRDAWRGRGMGDRGSMTFKSYRARHFVLQALSGWWMKVAPQGFGVLLRLEGSGLSDLLLVYRGGALEEFIDLETTGAARDLDQAVSEASDRFLVSVQGVSVPIDKWSRWSLAEEPVWKEVFQAMRSREVKLAPFRVSVSALIASKAYLGV